MSCGSGETYTCSSAVVEAMIQMVSALQKRVNVLLNAPHAHTLAAISLMVGRRNHLINCMLVCNDSYMYIFNQAQ